MMMDNLMRTPAAVVKRSFYERYGGFDTSLVHTADWDMWLRIIVNSGARMLNRPLARYRIFDASDTGRLRRSAEHLRDRLRFSDKQDAQNLTGFDRAAFNRELVRRSFAEARYFKRLGDNEAARANYKFFYECSVLRQRIEIYIERCLYKLGIVGSE